MNIEEFIKKSGVNTNGISEEYKESARINKNKILFDSTGGGFEVSVDVKKDVIAYLTSLSGKSSVEYKLKIEPEMLNEPNDISDLENLIVKDLAKAASKFDAEIKKTMSKF